MRMVDLILKKRAGGTHTPAEMHEIIDGFTHGRIPDYQMAAWMMAVCFKGMSEEETADLTGEMLRSGDAMDLSDLPGVKVDKHSTGGVGDTTTLVAAPLVAACGGVVAKMSGRGLGHTGGTLDKLEAIPGVCIEQSEADFKRIVRQTGLCVIGQSETLDPADKAMYALRDVTGTVESVPLIASSIMSKKLAAGADAIVLDVKWGSGAFMQTPAQAQALAGVMVRIGKRLGRRVMAVITDMNQPLGLAIGNGLEVREAIQMLRGEIPATDPLYQVCMLLASCMLQLSDVAADEAQAMEMLSRALRSGAGLAKLGQMLTALGALDAPGVLEDPDRLCRVRQILPVTLGQAGYIGDMRADEIGSAAQMLGAGRATKADAIDPAVGIVLCKRRGDKIGADEPFAKVYVNDDRQLVDAVEKLRGAVTVSTQKPAAIPIVYDVVRE